GAGAGSGVGAPALAAAPRVPAEIRRGHSGTSTTQRAFSRFVAELPLVAPEVAARLVTVSPGVAASAHLRAWIEKVGIWTSGERDDWFASEGGQHVELGLAEDNLAGLLGALGATWRDGGASLLPVGTVDEALMVHAQAPWAAGIARGGHSLLVGTGAHRSPLTPLVGLAQAGCVAWEPAFAQDLEWCLLDALARLGRADGTSAYVRLSTRPLDQSLAAVPRDAAGRAARRRDALAGGYRLHVPALPARVAIAAVGAVVPEALAAARMLANEGGIAAEVLCLTSPDLLFGALQARQGLGAGDPSILARLFPSGREAGRPLVTVLDGHPHTLAFLSAVAHAPIACLGLDEAGDRDDDVETIVGAALDVIG
ncbi:MAG: pyruvate dehydrogenase, partial [Conexibacter sp.]|nr:pyruvate dehydrogenase [Conexibacter sp.]